MKKNYLKIEKGQYLKDIIDQLVSNRIYFKILPGIGATTLEIQTKRWSIIIEPNVPVIKGKSNRNKNLLGVYESIDTGDVMMYLSNNKIEYKKILVTPESFIKVKRACERLTINIYKEFFLLFDECDRTMKDVKFRNSILEPMDDFFKFKQKAFISATAVIPTDPRFEEQCFELVYVKPTFDYSKEIEVTLTNNVSLALKSIIELHRDRTICVFLNHVRAIKAVITDLGIKDEARVFCSGEKMSALRREGYKANEHVEDNNYGSVNLFTSRFNSAVDVNMNSEPIVILVTNLYYADHTMIDPRSEAVQIVGRFRNGVDKLYAVTNIEKSLNVKTEQDATNFLAGCEQSYNMIKTFRDSVPEYSGARHTLDEALALVTYSKFINEDGSKNHYMFDNYLYEESVKCIYKSERSLKLAFKNEHFIPTFKSSIYRLSDSQYKIPLVGMSVTDQVTQVVAAIKNAKCETSEMMYVIDNRDIVLKELQRNHAAIFEAYHVLGESDLLKNGHSIAQIVNALKEKKKSDQKSFFPFLIEIIETFHNYSGSGESILLKLKSVIATHKLELSPKIKLLEDYFFDVRRTSLNGDAKVKIYKISNPKFNLN